jgi:PTS system nitrogen regulatory IIA component
MASRTLLMRDLLAPQSVVSRLPAGGKREVLQGMAELAAAAIGKDAHVVFDTLWEREKLGTTGVGIGIAIPHGRIEGIDQVHGFFARLEEPVNFDAIDDKPVDLVFLLLAPEAAGADHLHALAIVSRLLRDPKLCEQLRRAKGETEMYRILADASTAEAA